MYSLSKKHKNYTHMTEKKLTNSRSDWDVVKLSNRKWNPANLQKKRPKPTLNYYRASAITLEYRSTRCNVTMPLYVHNDNKVSSPTTD